MRPVPTSLQEELRTAVREFCDREVTADRLREWETTIDGADPSLGRAIASLGWLALGAPVAAGGAGAPLVDVALLVSECARGLLPRALVGAIRGVCALAEAAPGSPSLPELAAGERRLALAFDEETARVSRAFACRVEDPGGRVVVRGRKAYVADAEGSSLHLVAACEKGGTSLVLVDATAGGVGLTPVRTFGGDRQAHVAYDGAAVVEHVVSPDRGGAVLERIDRIQKALALAEMVGGMEAVLERTVAYVKEREQFGQKIGLFQAVRHQIADMGLRRTAARHLAWRAITRVSAGRETGHELESALVYVGRSFKELCFAGHHLHGGAGFVVEHPMRFHSERAQSLAIRWAPEGPALARIASFLLDGSGASREPGGARAE